MQYIDKSILEDRGKQIIDNLLNDCWHNDENKYIDADYATLSRYPFRTNFKAVLLEEQNEVCCYCMKKLENAHTTTLEHIIPHHASKEVFNTYNHPNFNANVIHLDDFDRELRIIPPDKYPHDIAYHNLIASCNSNTHCNHWREDKLIKPLIYNPNINTEIEYDSKGYAYSSEYLDDLETLGISVNKNLILYRLIWAEISKIKDININNMTEQQIEEILYELDYPVSFETIVSNFFSSPSKKPELLKYSWFFNYYRDRE